jgi:glucose-1-phosphate adenylyltransferase
MKRVVALVLAGGKGVRLEPLTRDRAKPAVPFGGNYRIIDFTLSNCINSGLRQILILTQYKAASLSRHLNMGWRFLNHELDEYIDILPPQQRIDENWYQGTADAVYQNIYSIERTNADYILILSGDHIYKMDYSELIRDHIHAEADVTIACTPVPLAECSQFGVIKVDGQNRVIDFKEKPARAEPMPDDPGHCLASMGVYVFNARFLFEQLCKDATQPQTQHDFGKNVVPSMIHNQLVRAFPFRDKNTGRSRYWRDVGTLEAYYDANMDLVSVDPELNLYDQSWPIRTYQGQYPPPKFVFADVDDPNPRAGHAFDSMICQGCIISGGLVKRSVLSPNVRVNSWATVEDSILFEGVQVGRHAKVRRAIVDKGVVIPEHARIGYDLERHRRDGLTVTESGIVVLAKNDLFDLDEPGEEWRPPALFT